MRRQTRTCSSFLPEWRGWTSQQISDRLEIEALLTRYTRAIDTGEWDRLDDVFTPDAQIDYTADRRHRRRRTPR